MQADGRPPVVQNDTIINFLLRTWSGRLVLINAVIFAVMAYQAGTFGIPSQAVLDQFGAKDPVAIAAGEWWRLISSMFVHIGLLHFLFNSYAIYIIGRQIETLVGMPWFVMIYLVSGLAGSIASAVFSIALSAGASGAIMGLLGCGLYVEKIIHKKIESATGQRPRRGVYFINTIFILIFGLVVPNIDNAAHIGGLVTGYALGAAILRLKPNRLLLVDRHVGGRIVAGVGAVMVVGLLFALSPTYVAGQFLSAARASHSPIERVYLLSKGLKADPANFDLLLERIRTVVFVASVEEVLPDIAALLKLTGGREQLERLGQELSDAGLEQKAKALHDYLDSQVQYL